MPDKVELGGKKIEILEIRQEEVLVRVAYGEIVIPRARVLKMAVDYPVRLERLKQEGRDTPRSLYALGRVCVQLEMKDEAQSAYAEALSRGDVPEDLLLPMATGLERLEAWGAARKCYQAYLKLHPDDAEVTAKARAASAKAAENPLNVEPPNPTGGEVAITEVAGTGGSRPGATTAPAGVELPDPEPATPATPANPATPATPATPANPAAPPEPVGPKIAEGLEALPGWGTEAWGSSVEISVSAQEGTTDKLLQVFLAGAEQDKACVILNNDFDLTNKKALTFDVYSFAEQRLSIAVAVITRPNWTFYESTQKAVFKTGNTPKTISFDLTNNRFKSAETKWRHRTEIKNRRGVVKLIILIYTKQQGQWLYFNNIKLEDADEPGPVPGAPAAPVGPAAPAGPAAAPAPAAPAAVAPAAGN
jgi:hypothetical protein